MARGPDGKNAGGAGFSLKDHLFNADSLGDLAREYAAGVAGFSPDQFLSTVLPQLPDLELMARLEAIADAIEAQLAPSFPQMANQIEAAMPPPLDPALKDDDFGRFIHAVPGILAVRHGLEAHRDRALDLLYAATPRFSMEFYIRPFLNRWPEETMARLALWATDENYHVRRLVSEGTRPKLPWAKAITLAPTAPLPFLDQLHADETRFVTRSVANHLNDISKTDGDLVVARLAAWRSAGQQSPKEMDWITRHALRGLVKQGHVGALDLLGYKADADVTVDHFTLAQEVIPRDAPIAFSMALSARQPTPVIVDYVLWFLKADGSHAPKVFKIKQAKIMPGKPLEIEKTHKLKWDATTFRLFPGVQRIGLQVNGRVIAQKSLTLE